MEQSLETQIIIRQAKEIGELRSINIELEIRLMQALETAEALAKELEAKENGDAKQQPKTADAERSTDSNSKRV